MINSEIADHLRTLGVILTNFHRSKRRVLRIVADYVNLL